MSSLVFFVSSFRLICPMAGAFLLCAAPIGSFGFSSLIDICFTPTPTDELTQLLVFDLLVDENFEVIA
jgi:hypothetical protein